jgi:dTDP-4-amino-4,6-dideoxygalactose transaminase
LNPHQVTKDFEAALCEYTGAKYAVAVTSCTMALLLACKWYLKDDKEKLVSIPARTYVSVPQSIIHAGGSVLFQDIEWVGGYQLRPYPIWDYARLFTSNMFNILTASEIICRQKGMFQKFQCVSFHWSKTLAIGQGGAILHDNDEADAWFRKMRFDGRTEGVEPKDDKDLILGYHCYMSPRDAADGLSRLAVLPKHNAPLPNSDYPDLSTLEIFK